jgi:hypothetical protein
MSLETPPAPPTEPATRVCPRCGASLTPDQEWCLNCGADVGVRVASTPRWRVPLILVGLLVAAALGAVVLALVELADDNNPQVAATPTAQPQAAAPTATPAPSPPAGEQPAPGEAGATGTPVPEASDDQTATGQSSTGSTPENEGGNTSSGQGSTGQSGNTSSGQGSTGTGSTGSGSSSGSGSVTVATWPAGKTAWTVILESATSKSAADQKAQELGADGTSVGVLHSDDFSSLNKGYWVVFSGQYDSKSSAQSALSGLTAKVPEAYVRHVVPN